MKFICTQENFNHSLNLVSRLSSRGVSLPILNNILIEARHGVIKLSTTNLEIGIKTELRGKVEAEGAFTVAAKTLGDYVNLLSKSNVVVALDRNQLDVSCDNFQTKMRGQAADEFPIIPEPTDKPGCRVATSELGPALEQTTFAVSTDDLRPELNGLCLTISGKDLVLAATDSYRLAEKKISLTSTAPGGEERKVVVPLKTAQELARIIAGSEDGEMEIFFDENQIIGKLGPTVVISKLVDARFPDYSQIIPNEFATRAAVAREALVQAVRAAALFTRSGINDIVLKLRPAENSLQVRITNSQVGEQESLSAARLTGEPAEVIFNYKYLLDGLQALKGEEITLELNADKTPALLKSGEDKNYLYLIMPIKQ